MKVPFVATLTCALASSVDGERSHGQVRKRRESDLDNHRSERRLERSLQIVNTVASSSQPSYESYYATDGNILTRWESNASDNQWLYVQFATEHVLDSVDILWEAAHAEDYDLETSNNAVTWTTVAQVRNSAGGSETIGLNSATAKYLRMRGIDRATSHGYSIREITVSRDESAYVPIVAASASSELNGNVAENAIDSDMITQWASANEDNEWISVQFDRAYFLRNAIFHWAHDFGEDYNVQTSQDGNSWMTAVEVRGGSGGVDVVDFPSSTLTAHVRMQGLERGDEGGSYGYSLYDVSFQKIASSIPDILPIIVETTASSFEDDFFPRYATDGDLSTRWASQREDEEWLAMDYGRLQSFSRVELHWEDAYGSEYNIEISDDGETWTSMLEVRNGNGGIEELNLPAGTIGRAIRMYGIDRGTQYGFSLYEMIVDNSDVNYPITTASSFEQDNFPAFATDNDLGTRWASIRGLDREWLAIDYGSIQVFEQVVLRWEEAFGSGYLIQVSDDGLVWNTALEITEGDGGVDVLNLPDDSTGRLIRMRGVERATQYGYSLYEMVVYHAEV